MKILLQAWTDLDLNIKAEGDHNGMTVMHMAVLTEDIDIVDLLGKYIIALNSQIYYKTLFVNSFIFSTIWRRY